MATPDWPLFNFYFRYKWNEVDFAEFQESLIGISRDALGTVLGPALLSGGVVSAGTGLSVTIQPYVAIGEDGYLHALNTTTSNLALTTAHATLARKDLIVARKNLVDSDNITRPTSPFDTVPLKVLQETHVVVIAGTPNASPAYPAKLDNDVVLAGVTVAALASAPSNIDTTVTELYTPDFVDPVRKLARFGNGSDGDLTASSGTTTLTRDTYYNTVTLTGTAKIDTAGYKLFIKTANFASAPADCIVTKASLAGGAASTFTAGFNIAGVTAHTMGGSAIGGGGDGFGGGSGGVAGTNGSNSTVVVGGANAGAGANGGLGSGGAGTAGAAGGVASGSLNPPQRLVEEFREGTTWTLFYGGMGGGGGGRGGSGGGGTYGGGGAGGSGGGCLWCAIETLVVDTSTTTAGAISAAGGNGGASGAASGGGDAGTGGGGGGGSGGCAWVEIGAVVGTKTNLITASGGAGGTASASVTGTGQRGGGGTGGGGGKILLIRHDLGTFTMTTGSAGSAGAAVNSTGAGGAGGACVASV